MRSFAALGMTTAALRMTTTVGLLLTGSVPLLVGLSLPGVAQAHDPSAWGGLYRSRDLGATWLLVNEGRFVTTAIDVAISPTDSAHLLLATDSGLLRSRNGGRDWELQAGGIPDGPVLAVSVDRDGERAMLSTGSGIFVQDWSDAAWREVSPPAGAAPTRAIVASQVTGRVYLAGWNAAFRSDDWGGSWAAIGEGLPDAPVTVLTVAGPPETLFSVSQGELWTSVDAGRSWQPRGNGLPIGRVDTVAVDPHQATSLWAAGADRLFRSGDGGTSWRAVGEPLTEPNTVIRGIGVVPNGTSIVLTTDRGLLHSGDGGMSWAPLTDNVPAHLEARPLVRDPQDPATIYVGFSIAPYDGLWANAVEGRGALARLDSLQVAGGGAFIALLAIAAGLALRRLGRYYGPTSENALLGSASESRGAGTSIPPKLWAGQSPRPSPLPEGEGVGR